MLYINVGQVNNCTLMWISCTDVQLCRSVVQLYINVGQLHWWTIM